MPSALFQKTYCCLVLRPGANHGLATRSDGRISQITQSADGRGSMYSFISTQRCTRFTPGCVGSRITRSAVTQHKQASTQGSSGEAEPDFSFGGATSPLGVKFMCVFTLRRVQAMRFTSKTPIFRCICISHFSRLNDRAVITFAWTRLLSIS